MQVICDISKLVINRKTIWRVEANGKSPTGMFRSKFSDQIGSWKSLNSECWKAKKLKNIISKLTLRQLYDRIDSKLTWIKKNVRNISKQQRLRRQLWCFNELLLRKNYDTSISHYLIIWHTLFGPKRDKPILIGRRTQVKTNKRKISLVFKKRESLLKLRKICHLFINESLLILRDCHTLNSQISSCPLTIFWITN